MILRRAFLKRMAQAALACALLGDIALPGLKIPEPIHAACPHCYEGFVMVMKSNQGGYLPEGGYLPQPVGPVYEKRACLHCNSPWKKVSGNKDAFEAYLTQYSQVTVKKMNIEQGRMFFGVEA